MKIAYVSHLDSEDEDAWSGQVYNIKRALVEQGHEVVSVRLKTGLGLWFRLKRIIYRLLTGKNFLCDRDPWQLKRWSAQARRQLADISHDLVFAPTSLYFAYLPVEKPLVFWTDATFGAMVDYYPEFTNLCAETRQDGDAAEASALGKVELAIYTSEWAARDAVSRYRIPPERVKVLPLGPNLVGAHSDNNIKELLIKRATSPCKLLFVGGDWVRKGGAFALAVTQELNRRGLRSELHIVGAKPPGDAPSFVRYHGFLRKSDPSHRARLSHLYSTSTFLILPTSAECYGIALVDACAHGLPSIAFSTGGLRRGLNCREFPLDTPFTVFCDYIESHLVPERYEPLVLAAFEEYKGHLNWPRIGAELSVCLEALGTRPEINHQRCAGIEVPAKEAMKEFTRGK
jgi:glycosyltransferase involved in cell wall biosynthesis